LPSAQPRSYGSFLDLRDLPLRYNANRIVIRANGAAAYAVAYVGTPYVDPYYRELLEFLTGQFYFAARHEPISPRRPVRPLLDPNAPVNEGSTAFSIWEVPLSVAVCKKKVRR
jgi:hypothetical protein